MGQYTMSPDFKYQSVQSGKHTLATWQKITNNTKPIHFYIEGDGRAFYNNGIPTNNPTPHGTLVRELASQDSADNVVYIARPCQFVFDENCNSGDWTNAKFSQYNLDSVANAVKQIAKKQPVVLIGYSGGALMTGLIIQQNTDINIKKWITIAGVLNHHDWTEYFGDKPLDKSLDLTKLPNVPQIHYVGDKDTVVPIDLSKKWIQNDSIKIIVNATHDDFQNLDIDFK